MVPTLTMFGRLRVATRGAAIPWFETALVTSISMTAHGQKVILFNPQFFKLQHPGSHHPHKKVFLKFFGNIGN